MAHEIKNPRQQALLDMNLAWLSQAHLLVEGLDDAGFVTSPQHLAPHKAGSHLRHVLEFYECFLDGLESEHIDYDSRRRDEAVSTNRAAAMSRILSIMGRLKNNPALEADNILFVKVEDGEGLGLADLYLISSVGRELATLSSHTIHHFALIAMTLRALGYQIHPDFGVAPSTLRHQAKQLRMAEAA